MKEKTIGDKIIFQYDIYDIVNNVEYEYDYTATLAGIVIEVIPDTEHGGYTKYKISITKSIHTNGEKYLEPGNVIETTDDKIYRGSRLHDVLYHGECQRPTVSQIARIIDMYDHDKSLEINLKRIFKTWYKFGLDKFGLYDEDEFKF